MGVTISCLQQVMLIGGSACKLPIDIVGIYWYLYLRICGFCILIHIHMTIRHRGSYSRCGWLGLRLQAGIVGIVGGCFCVCTFVFCIFVFVYLWVTICILQQVRLVGPAAADCRLQLQESAGSRLQRDSMSPSSKLVIKTQWRKVKQI